MTAVATYRFYVDWDGDGGFDIGQFEIDEDGWEGAGSHPPAVSVSADRAHLGSQSLLVLWPYIVSADPFRFDTPGAGFGDGAFGGVSTLAQRTLTGLTPGSGYGVSLWVYVPAGAASVRLEVPGIATSSTSTLTAAWERLALNFTATETEHVIAVAPTADTVGILGATATGAGTSSTPDYLVAADADAADVSIGDEVRLYGSGGILKESTVFTVTGKLSAFGFTNLEFSPDAQAVTETGDVLQVVTPESVWVDEVMLIGPGEDITDYVLGVRQGLEFTFGRDQARSLSAVAPSDVTMELNNLDRRFTPDNPGSPIAGLVSSGKEIVVMADYEGHSYVLFRGFLNDFELTPDPDKRSVSITSSDIMGVKLAEATISTALYQGLRTGEAIHVVLDSVGWPEHLRDIDPGATVIRYWWEEGTTALEAINKLVSSEGASAFVTVDVLGRFVFRDRHHRLLHSESLAVQANFRDTGTEPTFGIPMTYDIGWRDIVNSMTVSIDERRSALLDRVWSTEDTITVAAGETRTLAVESNDPFHGAIDPEAGTDYVLNSGVISVSLSRRSGQSAQIHIKSDTGASITGFALRAYAVPVALTYQVDVEDTASVEQYGRKTSTDEIDMPWAGVHDAQAIGTVLIGHRAERLPVVHITVNNGNSTRLTQVLSRDLSDRVHIVEAETFTDHDFYVEQIEHDVQSVGFDHKATFGCERIRNQVSPVFTFDDPAAGFDDGLFGLAGIDDPDSVFILGQSNLGEGLLAH